MLGPKGEAELVNYRMRGRYYVVARGSAGGAIEGPGEAICHRRTAEPDPETLAGSKLLLVEGSGHMVHYAATDEVAAAIEEAVPAGAAGN